METTAEPVSWDLARRVAAQVGRRGSAIDGGTLRGMQRDFDEFTEIAEGLVADSTGLRSLVGPARARVTDRAGWVSANIASFRRLISPLTDKLSSGPMPPLLGTASRAVTGAQVGLILGWMSGRVLGQYDLLLAEDDHPEDQDVVYYVGPNVRALERKYGFPPREFRLWIALHEVTHRAQFTGVPWLRPHFIGLVERGLSMASPDPRQLLDSLMRAASDIRAGRNPLRDAGIVGVIAGPEQLATLHEVQALMSVLEGHGDVTMDRAAAGLVPSAGRFSSVLRARRSEVRGTARFLQQLIGIEAKMRQYQEGERFVEKVEAAGGTGLFERIWQSSSMLPTLEELRSPDSWIARVGGPAIASA
ncbi:MAG TPA: zinc-dependent metalloprotease [Acidimicrobiales bacterium]|nr:zinc-dependent metalloprotease [Acidimicrobiales bacterium]